MNAFNEPPLPPQKSGPAFSSRPSGVTENLRVPVGFSAPQGDTTERRLSLESYLATHPDSTFYMKTEGDAMSGAGVFDGDLLVIDRRDPPKAGDVVVAVADGEFVVRRLEYDVRGNPVLRAANPAFREIPVGKTEGLGVWGVVKWTVHKV